MVEDGVTLVDIGSHPLRFDAAHLGFAHTFFGNFGNLGSQSRFELLGGFAFGRYRVEHEHLRSTATHGVRGACAVGQAALALRQSAVQACTVVTIQNSSQKRQRQCIAVVVSGFKAREVRHFPRQGEVGLVGRSLHQHTAGAGLDWLFTGLARRHHAWRNLPIGGLSQTFDLGHIHIAHHHDGGIGRHIPAAVKVSGVLRCHGVQVVHPTDDGATVRRGDKLGGVELLVHQHARRVFGTHTALFFHHLNLFGELNVWPLVVSKAIGFQRHYLGQTLGRNLLVITGVVLVGECVFTPTQCCHASRKLALLDLGRAFEEHVFQDMRNARDTIHLVHGTHPHPQHVHRGGGTWVHFDDERHAIFQSELLGLGCGLCQGGTQRQQQRKTHEPPIGVGRKS